MLDVELFLAIPPHCISKRLRVQLLSVYVRCVCGCQMQSVYAIALSHVKIPRRWKVGDDWWREMCLWASCVAKSLYGDLALVHQATTALLLSHWGSSCKQVAFLSNQMSDLLFINISTCFKWVFLSSFLPFFHITVWCEVAVVLCMCLAAWRAQ